MHIPRTLTVEGRTFSEHEVLGTGSVLIVLAEPGAGKTDLLDQFATILQTTRIRASIFRHRDAPGGAGLVIDAMDEVARTDPTAVDAIVAKAAGLGRAITIIAGRSSEWDQSRTLYVEDCFGLTPVIVRLNPFDQQEQRRLFEAVFPEVPFDGFLREAVRMDLGGLLGNPQFLQLLGDAYIESGHVFISKAKIFEDATRRLAYEANRTIPPAGRPPRERIMAWGDEIFAKLLLSGAIGVTTVEMLDDRDFPFLAAVAGAEARLVLDTRLFKPADGDDRHEPVHRIVAEYCAARYLARRLATGGDRLSLPRLLSIVAPSGAVRTELRGLVGWLAALSGEEIQIGLAELDPYAVLANGDPGRLTARAKQSVLTGLMALSSNDPFFRRGDVWRRFNVGQFFTEDIRERVCALLDPAAPDIVLRDLMVELVRSSDAGSMFAPELERIVLAVATSSRRHALDILIEADPDRAVGLVVPLIADGSSVSLALAAQVFMALGTDRVGVAELIALLAASAALFPTSDGARARDPDRRYFIRRLTATLGAGTARDALDALSNGLACSCSPTQPWRCRCRVGISKVVGHLLDRYLEISIGPHDPARLWQWLSPLHFSGARNGDDSTAVRFLRDNDGLRRAVQWLAVTAQSSAEETQLAVSNLYSGTRHAGLLFEAADLIAMAERANVPARHDLWEAMLVGHNPHNSGQRASPIRTLQRRHALADPALMRIWAARQRRWRQQRAEDFRGVRFRPGRHKRREAKIKEGNRAHFLTNRAIITAGQFGGWTDYFANMYLLEPAELAALDYGTTPQDALRNCLPHLMPHIPALRDLASGTGREYAKILFAHCLVVFRAGDDLSILAPEVLRLAYTEAGSWPTLDEDADEARAFGEALERAVFSAPNAARLFVDDYIEPAVAATGDAPTHVHWLTDRPAFAGFLSSRPMAWLERYDRMPLRAMEALFEMAARHGDRARLSSLIDTRYADAVHNSGGQTRADVDATFRHRFWALQSFFFETASLDAAWAELRLDKNVVLEIQDAIGWFGGRDQSHLPQLSPEAIFRVLDTFVAAWPPVPLASGYGTHSPKGELAFRFLIDLIWKIGKADPSERLPVLDAMLADMRFAIFRAQLLTLRAEALRDLALRDFVAPEPNLVVAMLDRSEVATIEDLRALMVEELGRMQIWLRGAETDPLNTFYYGDAHVDENTGRNRVVDRLEARMLSLGLSVEIERHMAAGNRCDITVSATLPGARRLLVIEVKGQWNGGLFTAAAEQLAERYSIHPDAAGQGIYLVFWYGPDTPIAGLTSRGIASPAALEEAILLEMPEPLRAAIDVVVLDVSRAAAPVRTHPRRARRADA